ncbi:glycosyltransferase family 2 protein [Aureivirga marina]|uniref:glycosyltransferase family 2 protein n=1 Tax=Aureivirga marina TaxID=1182451 RepID=UPI0018C910D1|nr:glycosyltransferase family 2 protein [Aureivirga marina]
MTKIKVIIPAYNEGNSIANVVNDIPDIVEEVIVVNNNSSDTTEINAKKAGATVLRENRKGYGYACLKGMEYIENQTDKPDIIVFLDGDYSDYPEQLLELIEPIEKNGTDMVIGARSAAFREKGAMTPQQVFGNWLATTLMKWIYGAKFTDLGPFRAIKYDKLMALNMQDKTYGWTVEMQIKALKQKFTYCEIPMKYRKRIGVSKVSGTVKGTIMAGYKIIMLIFKYSIR